MTYLHANNIIHRDLKTPNLLLDDTDQVRCCCWMDTAVSLNPLCCCGGGGCDGRRQRAVAPKPRACWLLDAC